MKRTNIRVKSADISVTNHGSLWLFTALSFIGRDWMSEHMAIEPWQGSPYDGVAVDHRYGPDIVVGARGDGLTVTAGTLVAIERVES